MCSLLLPPIAWPDSGLPRPGRLDCSAQRQQVRLERDLVDRLYDLDCLGAGDLDLSHCFRQGVHGRLGSMKIIFPSPFIAKDTVA